MAASASRKSGSEQGDVQVPRGVRRDVGARTEPADDGARRRQHHDGHDRTDQRRQPEAVHPLGERALRVAGTHPPGDGGRGAVGEEDAQADQGAEHRRGDPEPGQLRGAEVADDGGVGEEEERLGHQGEEGRNRQPHDLAVVRASAGAGEGHPNRLDPQ